MPEKHQLLSEATDAGFLGATTVAVWFLVFDSIVGRPFRTPSVLGQLFLFGERHPNQTVPDFGAIVLYTGAHFILFVLFGLAVAALVRLAATEAVVRFALLVVFVVFEFFFYVVINVVSEEVGALFPLWSVAGANLLASLVMAAYFWRRYPELGRALREEPLGG